MPANRNLSTASAETVSGYLDVMAHDVRTPLHTLLVYSECLADELYGEVTEEQKEIFQMLGDSAKYLNVLIDNILSSSQSTCGEVQLIETEFSVDSYLQAVLRVLSEKAKAKKTALISEVDVTDILLHGDQGKINQAMTILISTAIKASRGGPIQLSACARDGSFVLELWDPTGIFIVETLPSLDQVVDGSLLGLALAKLYVELHGGSLELESGVDKGLRLVMHIPVNL